MELNFVSEINQDPIRSDGSGNEYTIFAIVKVCVSLETSESVN